MGSPAMAPAGEGVSYMLGQLMERTKDLPQLKEDVVGVKVELENLRADFRKHSEATDKELARIRGGAVKTKTILASMRGEWKTAVLLFGIVAEHVWKRLVH